MVIYQLQLRKSLKLGTEDCHPREYSAKDDQSHLSVYKSACRWFMQQCANISSE